MRKIKEVIVVEGRYDKNALAQVVDATVITLRFDGRFDVLLSPDDDFGYKLDCLLAVVDTKLEQNEKGTIDLTRKEVRFVPG